MVWGANGKSTFLKLVSSLLGDYAQTASFDTFLIQKNDNGTRNDIARMLGKRFISSIEGEQGKRLAETLVKSLTGGDTITARFLFAEFFDFQPTHKIWLAANHKPNIKGTDHAIWRRIKLIPFNITIPDDRQDKHLEEKLRAELPGILAWAVRGCLEWQRIGLQTPDEIIKATNFYRDEMDVIGNFLKDRCLISSDKAVKTPTSTLYEAYKDWCSTNNEFALDNRRLGRSLSDRGYISSKSGGKNCWFGIGILEK